MHGDSLVSPVTLISHANLDGLWGIPRRHEILGRSQARFSGLFEVCGSLACLEETVDVYNFPSRAISRVPVWQTMPGEFMPAFERLFGSAL